MLDEITTYFQHTREKIIKTFESLEENHRFERKPWKKEPLGFGEIGVMRGEVFEKAAVNFSKVSGENFPMQDGKGPYVATGISLITHLQNPHMPTAHFNVRYMQFENAYWFGGGFDLTPMGFDKDEDTQHFHDEAKKALDPLDPTFYPLFSETAREYFFINHWKKERGVGGIFFDHHCSGDINKDFKLIQAVCDGFLKALMPIYEKNKNLPYTTNDKNTQNHFRAHYVEFNLLYDRGTQFGFKSGGNPEAILCSMPPTATW